jgi:hypothetical protein
VSNFKSPGPPSKRIESVEDGSFISQLEPPGESVISLGQKFASIDKEERKTTSIKRSTTTEGLSPDQLKKIKDELQRVINAKMLEFENKIKELHS